MNVRVRVIVGVEEDEADTEMLEIGVKRFVNVDDRDCVVERDCEVSDVVLEIESERATVRVIETVNVGMFGVCVSELDGVHVNVGMNFFESEIVLVNDGDNVST